LKHSIYNEDEEEVKVEDGAAVPRFLQDLMIKRAEKAQKNFNTG